MKKPIVGAVFGLGLVAILSLYLINFHWSKEVLEPIYFSPQPVAELPFTELPTVDLPVDYHVIVVGTDPEGIAAAVSSARNGLTTLLVDHRQTLGGLMTVGGLNTIDMNYSPRKEIITKGIFLEVYNQLEGDSFQVDTAVQVFEQLVAQESNLEVKLATPVLGPLMVENRLVGVTVLENGVEKEYYAKRLIDATQDGDLAAMAGVPYSIGMEDIGIRRDGQVVTLVFEVGGVDWRKLRNNLRRNRDNHSGANNHSAWGFPEEMAGYKAQDPQIRMRGLNIGRQGQERVLINAMHIFGVDPLDQESRKLGLERGQAELPNIISYLKEHITGFEKAYLMGSMDELYVRESRHIYGEYRLSINDVLEHVDFWDKVALGSYPVDVQATSMTNTGYVLGNPDIYSIPFRSLVPLEVDHLLVVGRAASFDSLAHGSARMIPIGMGTGQAAGVAAAYSLDQGMNFRQLSRDREAIKTIQEALISQGAYLPDFAYPHGLEDHWALEGVRFFRSLGLAFGGYDNNYKLDKPMSGMELQNLFNNTIKRSLGETVAQEIGLTIPGSEVATIQDGARACLYMIGLEAEVGDPLEILVAGKMIEAQLAEVLAKETQLTRSGAYMLLAQFFNYISSEEGVVQTGQR